MFMKLSYDTIRYDSVYLRCSKKLTASQLSVPQFFWVFNSPSTRPQGPMDPRGGRGTSADIVPTHIKFGVDPSTRCWDIAQKPCTKMQKNSPLTPIVTKISFPPFSAPGGPLTPNRGEDIRNQSTPACKIWRESARGSSRNRWQKTYKKQTYIQ